jgi:hypothetical protein
MSSSGLAAGMLLAIPTFAQTFGEVTGLVTDPTGAVVVGFSITAINPQTNFTRKTVTNASGSYAFPSLLAVNYNLRAELQGFQTEIRNGIERCCCYGESISQVSTKEREPQPAAALQRAWYYGVKRVK